MLCLPLSLSPSMMPCLECVAVVVYSQPSKCLSTLGNGSANPITRSGICPVGVVSQASAWCSVGCLFVVTMVAGRCIFQSKGREHVAEISWRRVSCACSIGNFGVVFDERGRWM